MMSLHFTFYLFIGIFAFIGLMRGWRKELIVSFSVILGLTLIVLLRKYLPLVAEYKIESLDYFWLRLTIIGVLIFFGYQTAIYAKLNPRVASFSALDSLIGMFVGAINGYLLVGTLWAFLTDAQYPFPDFILSPVAGTALGDAALKLVNILPPYILLFKEPIIYFVQIGCFMVLLAVFI